MGVIMTIRDKFGYVLVGGIAVAIVLFLLGDALSTGGNLFQANSNNAGSVNGEAITYNEFSLRLDKNTQNFQLQTGSSEITDEQMNALREQTWNDLVRERLLAKEFEKLGIAVTEDEIYQMFFGPNPHEFIAQNFRSQITGQFDPMLVQQYIDNLNVADANGSPEEKRTRWTGFEQALIKERLDGKYSTLLTQSVYVPKWYTTAYSGFKNASVSVEYVLLPYASVADDQIKITDSDLREYLNKHEKEFEQEESLILEYVVFNVVPSTADTAATERDLNELFGLFKEAKNDSTFVLRNSATPYTGAYLTKEEIVSTLVDTFFTMDTMTYVGPYLENGQYKVAKLLDRKMLADSVEVANVSFNATNQAEFDSLTKLADTLVKQINAGTLKFSEVLNVYSADSATKAKGGVIGWVKPGTTELVSEYVQDQVLYRRKQGEAVLYFDNTGLVQIAYVATAVPTKPAVKVAILSKPIAPGKATEREYYDKANEFYNSHNTRETFAKAQGVSPVQSPKLKKSDNIVPGLGGARELIKAAYNAEPGTVLSPQVLTGKYVVAMVKDVSEGGKPTVDQVRNQLEAAVKLEKKAELLKGKIGSDKDLNSIATKNGTNVSISQNLNLNSNTFGAGAEPAVAGAALGLELGQVSGPIKGKAGIYVIKVTAKNPANIADDALSFEKQMMSMTLRNQTENSYFNALKKLAEVVDDRYKFY